MAAFFRGLARALGGSAGREPTLAAVDGMVRLVLLVVIGDEGRPDPVETRRGWRVLAKVEQELARAQAGFWVRLLSAPGRPTDQLHPARRDARAERAPDGEGVSLAEALEAARVILDRDVAALKGGSWLVDRPAIVLYAGRVPLSDPRTVRAYRELLAALRPVVTWIVPPGSAELIAPQLRAGATISTEHRGGTVEVARLVCDELAAN